MVNGMGFRFSHMSRYIVILKGKNQKNKQENERREEKRQNRWKQGTHGCATQDARPCTFYHRQPMVASAWSSPDASRTLHFGALLVREFLPWIIRIGPIGLLLLTSLIF